MKHLRSLPTPFLVLLLLAFSLRLFLVPLSYGGDFFLFEVAAKKTLEAKNIYALYLEKVIHLFAYPPLFLYVLAPLKFISLKIGIIGGMSPFRVLGKLPAVIADIALGYLIYLLLRKAHKSEARAALGSFLYLFNPLILYNTAYYGRFDALPLFFLLLAMHAVGRPRSALFEGLAIALKTFPLFLLPAFIKSWEGQRTKKIIFALLIPVVISLPHFLLNPIRFITAVFLLHAAKPPSFSWQHFYSIRFPECYLTGEIPVYCPPGIIFISMVLLVLFLVALFVLAEIFIKRRENTWNLIEYAAIVFPLFLLFSKVINEQYLVWSLPFLILVFLRYHVKFALILYLFFTVSGIVRIHEDVFSSLFPYWGVALALVTIAGVIAMARVFRQQSRFS